MQSSSIFRRDRQCALGFKECVLNALCAEVLFNDVCALIEGGIYVQNNDTPEHELLREELAQVVSKALAQLPEEIRQAITLREMEGLSYEEIAEVMNSPVGTVRSRIFRAREAIDARLRPLYESQRVRP